MENKDINLCDTCVQEVPLCTGKNIEYGDGKGKDNIIECDEYVIGVDLANSSDQTAIINYNSAGEVEEVKTIDSVVDMPIVKFIMFLQGKSFAVVNAIGKQLEMAMAQVQQARIALELVRGKMKPEDVEKSFNQFITTFVVEKEILNKLDVLKSIKKVKGVKFSEID